MFEEGLGDLYDKRTFYFEGSQVFCSRPIPGISKADLPKELVSGLGSAHGDYLKIMGVKKMYAPDDVVQAISEEEESSEENSSGISVDLRCMDCLHAFTSKHAMELHCRDKGHRPYLANREDDDAEPAKLEELCAYANVVLGRALGQRLAKWGHAYVDPKSFQETRGVRIFKAYVCEFGFIMSRDSGTTNNTNKKMKQLALTVDVRARLQRSKSLLDMIREDNRNNDDYSRDAMERLKRRYCGQTVIYTIDKRCFDIVDLDFGQSARSLPVSGLNMNHAEYFESKKKITLQYPDARPLCVVIGRDNKNMHLPAELVCCNELDASVRAELPKIASFTPDVRHDAIDEIRKFLVPGGHRSKDMGGGLLPSVGIVVHDERIRVPVTMIPFPLIQAAGHTIPESKKKFWAGEMTRVNYRVEPSRVTDLKILLVYSRDLARGKDAVFDRMKREVNKLSCHFRVGDRPYDEIEFNGPEDHWRSISDYFRQKQPQDNIFVLNFTKPRTITDPVYPVVKKILAESGILSQFVNFFKCDHTNPKVRNSNVIIGSCARQVVAKCGVRMWHVALPRELPTPAIFVGIDVFHSPRKLDLQTKKRTAKKSCAACIVTVIDSHDRSKTDMVKIYSETLSRSAGHEMDLGKWMKDVLQNAMKELQVDPRSCFIWRDGVGDPSIKQVSADEMQCVRQAFDSRGEGASKVPLCYLICQKRISTKFITEDKRGLAPGAMITDLQGVDYRSFYIHGASPNFSTPKSTRFVVVETDDEVKNVNISDLTWALCHDYPNWCGPVKLPSPVQYAHKLAELAGGFSDNGDSIDNRKYAKTVYFL